MLNCLHVGCGGDSLPFWLKDYKETRLDINPKVKPDIVASMTNLGDIGNFDLIYSSHCLEHLFAHEVSIALKEFIRVADSVVILVPDLEDVSCTNDVILMAPSGPITGIDMIYGHREFIIDNPFMQHKTGFTKEILETALKDAGYKTIDVKRLTNYNLFGAAKR